MWIFPAARTVTVATAIAAGGALSPTTHSPSRSAAVQAAASARASGPRTSVAGIKTTTVAGMPRARHSAEATGKLVTADFAPRVVSIVADAARAMSVTHRSVR